MPWSNKPSTHGLIPGAVLIVGQDGRILHRQSVRRARAHSRARSHDAGHDFRRGLAYESHCHHALGDAAFGAGQTPHRGSGDARYLPEFPRTARARSRIRDLMTHFSGLRPDLDLDPRWYRLPGNRHPRALTIRRPAARHDLRLQRYQFHPARRDRAPAVSGEPLNEYAREIFFEPLGMRDTMFLPPASLAPAHRSHRNRSRHRALRSAA